MRGKKYQSEFQTHKLGGGGGEWTIPRQKKDEKNKPQYKKNMEQRNEQHESRQKPVLTSGAPEG